jgi:hypothetical protein
MFCWHAGAVTMIAPWLQLLLQQHLQCIYIQPFITR